MHAIRHLADKKGTTHHADVRADLGGFLLIRYGIGSTHDIVGVGIICQGEADTGAGHLMAVQRQHVYRLKRLIINQAHLLLADAATYKPWPC